MSGRRSSDKKEFIAFLKRCKQVSLGENVDFDELFKTFDEDPEVFQSKWVWPLLDEGLSLDQACEMVVKSIFRPD